MLHHEVVDFLSIFIPPFLLVVCMVEVSLPFCCFKEVGWVQRVRREDNGWCLEFSHSQLGKWAVKLEAVCGVLGDGLDVEIEGGCCLGSPCVV